MHGLSIFSKEPPKTSCALLPGKLKLECLYTKTWNYARIMEMQKLKKFWHSLGPGLIVGAADDDPAGIVIYALAGAKFGLSVLWTVLGTLPFMIIIQRMCGRIGLVSGRGLAGNIRKHYPGWILFGIAIMISVNVYGY